MTLTPERLAEITERWKRYGVEDDDSGEHYPVPIALLAAIPDLLAHSDAQAAEIERQQRINTEVDDEAETLARAYDRHATLILEQHAQLTRYKAAMVKIREEASGSSPDGTAIWQWANAALEDNENG